MMPKLPFLQVGATTLPPGSLLTLVENAIEHGIAPALTGGQLRISAHEAGGEVVLQVRDTAARLPSDWREGVGLANTRERLLRCFGPAAKLTLLRTPDGCTEATLRWPSGAQLADRLPPPSPD